MSNQEPYLYDPRVFEQQLPVFEEAPLLDRPARLQLIKETYGFFPQSNEELSQIISLTGRQDNPYPVLQYIDEICRHQYTYKADARTTTTAVVRGFTERAWNAYDQVFSMQLFGRELEESGAHTFSSFDTLFPTEQWVEYPNKIATLTVLSRYLETKRFVENETQDSLLKRSSIDETSGEERVARILSNLKPLRAGQLKQLSAEIAESQELRAEYWKTQLEAASQHLFAREQAREALLELQ